MPFEGVAMFLHARRVDILLDISRFTVSPVALSSWPTIAQIWLFYWYHVTPRGNN